VSPVKFASVNGTDWLFVIVACLITGVFRKTVPNDRAGGLTVTAPSPVPFKLTDCGLFSASSTTERDPAGCAPGVDGVIVTLTTQLPPGATGVPTTQVLVGGDTAYGSAVAIEEMFSGTASWLTKVTFFAALAVPTRTLPKFNTGESVAGISPAPVNTAVCGLLPAESTTVICPL
jgi:hypothetical protein